MRIPKSHPLVNKLIKLRGLPTKPFFQVDVSADDRSHTANRTWIRTNNMQIRRGDYTGTTDLGFPLAPSTPPLGTASQILAKALERPLELINPKLPFDEQIKGWKQVLKEYDEYSMRRYLLQFFDEITVQYVGTLQNLTSRLFLSFMHSFVDTFYINSDTQYVELAGGNDALPKSYQQDLSENIVMEARVVELQWTDGVNANGSKAVHRGNPGVYARTTNEPVLKRGVARHDHARIEREFTADYAIVTIPFTALRVIDVSPQFSYPKRRAIIELHYDSATKVLLEFSERFWEWDEAKWRRFLPDEYRGHASVGGGSVTDHPCRFIYYPSHTPASTSRGGVVLASYTWADDANRWDSMPEEDRYNLALDGLVTIYGKGIRRFYTGYGKTESWMNNYYALGEAAVFAPGQITALHPYIQKPEGRVHFAGEHTSMKHAWIEGAIESAVRVALEIHGLHTTTSTAKLLWPALKLPADVRAIADPIRAVNRANTAIPNVSTAAPGTTPPTVTISVVPTVDNSISQDKLLTVAQYLNCRLEQLRLGQLFCVAGNYVAPLLDSILEDRSSIRVTGMPNELSAGFAADGYARVRGIGAVAVTYGVGALSLLNAVAGSHVERVPVVVINGAPTMKESLNQLFAGLLYSHMTADPNANINIFRPVTGAAVRIVNGNEAAIQIDCALTACITHNMPVYLEVAEDVWRAPCSKKPTVALSRVDSALIATSEAQQAVQAVIEMIHTYKNPVFWAGIELQRYQLHEEFLRLVRATGIHFTTSVQAKSVVSEDDPQFLGVYGPYAPSAVRTTLRDVGCIIGLGAWTTGKDVLNKNIRNERVALAAHKGVIVGARFFPIVALKEFLELLTNALCAQAHTLPKGTWNKPSMLSITASASCAAVATKTPLTYDLFFAALNKWLNSTHVVISDASFPLLGAQSLHIAERGAFWPRRPGWRSDIRCRHPWV